MAQNQQGQDSGQEAAAGEAAMLAVGQTEQYGEFIVDGDGRPLYLFEPDTQGEGEEEPVSTCYDACADAWPPLLAAEVETEEGAQADLAATFERRTGEQQASYNGWPLYYFVQDSEGQPPQGQDVEGFGGEWYLITPEGEKVGH